MYYKPHDGWLADVIPFYDEGEFKLFYLQDWRNHETYGEGTPWFLLGTKDFITFTEYGEVLPRGGAADQDLYIYTGCIIKAGERYHIFYTGNNFHYPAQGRKQQGVMHATSPDLLHWTKLEEDTFFAPEDGYEPHDWRDPFVFWNEEAGEYWMLLAARLNKGPDRRRGCIALCASADLRQWEVREPFWAPYLYATHECPDLFRIGEWWYLVYSTFSDRSVTHYRMSKSLSGPWTAPDNDALDNRAFYAAKTWSDGEKRYAFGWNPTREGERDEGGWQWGGHLVVHEVVQQPDGSLRIKAPDSLAGAFRQERPVEVRAVVGDWTRSGLGWIAGPTDGFACALAGELPASCCMIDVTLVIVEPTRSCGIVLYTDEALDNGYMLRLEPDRSRIVFDQWPRKGDIPHVAGLERPLALQAGKPCRLQLFIDGTICVTYINEAVALSARLYKEGQRNWGVFLSEGSASFELKLRERQG